VLKHCDRFMPISPLTHNDDIWSSSNIPINPDGQRMIIHNKNANADWADSC